MAYGLGEEVYEWRLEVLMFRLQAYTRRRRRPSRLSAKAKDNIRRDKGLARRRKQQQLMVSEFLEKQQLLKRGYKI